MMKRIYQSISTIGRLLFVVFIVIGAFVFAMFQGGVVSWTIFYAILPFTLYSLLLFFYPLSGFSAERIVTSTYYQVGDVLKIEVILTRKMPFPLLYMVVHDEWIDGESSASIEKKHKLLLVGWKRKLNWTYATDHLMRGEHIASEIQLEVTDFFGWIQKKKKLPVTNTLLVYPKVEKVHYVPLKTRYAGGLASSPFTMLKDTNIVTGIRDYEEGDRMSWIHWKSFARTQTLMTKEFDESGSQDLQLVFDNRTSSTFEAQITFAASILQEVQKEKLSIQFLPVHQTEAFLGIQSEERFRMILTYLAKVQPEKVEQIFPTASFKKALNQDGMVVVITGRIDQDLQALMDKLVMKHRSIVCFVIVENEQSMTSSIRDEINIAEAKGIIVQLIKERQFTDAFKEVASR